MLEAGTDPSALAGLEIVDRRGERIGRVRQIYPEGAGIAWAGVRGNLFGTEEVLVPLDGAVLDEDVIGVPVSRARFASAPRRRPDAALDEPERLLLRRFWAEQAAEPATEPDGARSTEPEAGAQPPEEEGVMTASEERLHVETERVPRMRVRLRKVVVTEQRTVTVPVRREEYRLVREPIEDADPVPGAVIGAAEQEVVLYEERVVVTTEVVPVERIRLIKEEVVETREVVGSVRRERIELEDEAGAVAVAPIEPEVLDAEPDEPIDAETVEPAPALLPAGRQPTAPAMLTKASTSRRSPRRDGSTPARSSTSVAATAPPSTGASD